MGYTRWSEYSVQTFPLCCISMAKNNTSKETVKSTFRLKRSTMITDKDQFDALTGTEGVTKLGKKTGRIINGNGYAMFRSSEGLTTPAQIYDEYAETLRLWTRTNPVGTDLDEFRKEYGVLFSVEGQEVFSGNWLTEKRRESLEYIQAGRGERFRATAKRLEAQGLTPEEILKALPERQKGLYAGFMNTEGGKREWESILRNEIDSVYGQGYSTTIEIESFEGHHIRGLAGQAPFFEGVTDPMEAFEIRQTIANRGHILGAQRGNFLFLSRKQHARAHELLGFSEKDGLFDLDRPGGKSKGVPTDAPLRNRLAREAPAIQPNAQHKSFRDLGWTIDEINGVDPLDPYIMTKGDYAAQWLDYSTEAQNIAIERAIMENPMKGVDPAVQIRAHIRMNNPDMIKNARDNLSTAAENMKGSRVARGMNRTEALMRIAAGDYLGGSIGLAMQTDTFRERVMKELLKRGGKMAAKLAPGVGITMGAMETAGYASQGRWLQSGIAAIGAAAGEFTGLGDLVQGGTDILNTGIDALTGNLLPGVDEDEYNLRTKQARQNQLVVEDALDVVVGNKELTTGLTGSYLHNQRSLLKQLQGLAP